VDCDELVNFAKSIDGVAISKTYSFLCTESGQDLIMNDIRELDIDRVVVAA